MPARTSAGPYGRGETSSTRSGPATGPIDAFTGATPLTTQQMFDNEAFLVNYSRDEPIEFGFRDLYDLRAAEAAKP